jgi:hypothetical protein
MQTCLLGARLRQVKRHTKAQVLNAPEQRPVGRFRLVGGCLGDRATDAAETRVVEHAVEPAVPLYRFGHERLDLALVPDVGVNIGDRRPELVLEAHALVVLDIRRADLRASRRKTSTAPWPIPLAAPVTMATLPASLLMAFLPFFVHVRHRARSERCAAGTVANRGHRR